MTDQPLTATTTSAAMNRMQEGPVDRKGTLRADIGAKWSKFSEQELAELKDNDDLVACLAAKYGLARDVALRDAAAVVQGRTF